jgi:hypothetical protein
MGRPVRNRRSPSHSRSQLYAGPQRASLVLAFVAGLLLGWIVVGWWLWPVRWTNSEPWDLRPEYQRTYVALVAESYGQTRDVARAREALDGWDHGSLARLLAEMETQVPTLEERQRLADLADALALPEVQGVELASLLNHKAIILSALLSALPLVLAIILAVSPLMRNGTRKAEELPAQGVGGAVAELEEEFERLLAGEEGEDWGYRWPE